VEDAETPQWLLDLVTFSDVMARAVPEAFLPISGRKDRGKVLSSATIGRLQVQTQKWHIRKLYGHSEDPISNRLLIRTQCLHTNMPLHHKSRPIWTIRQYSGHQSPMRRSYVTHSRNFNEWKGCHRHRSWAEYVPICPCSLDLLGIQRGRTLNAVLCLPLI
jgi:hypothetical protein